MKKKNRSLSGLIIFLWVFISFPQTGMGLFNEAAANSSGQKKVELNLEEMVQPVPISNGFHQNGYFVWCGAPVRGDDGRYHLFYSRWPVTKGFAPGWAIWSEIAYAIADCPEGPYQFVNVALPARGLNPATRQKYWDGDVTHNPYILREKGKYYLFYMGNFGDGTYAGHRNNQRIGLAIAEKPEGPWIRVDAPIVDVSPDKSAFDSLCVTNPAVAIQPDGGVLLIYKAVQYDKGKLMGGNVRFGVARADRIEGPYIKIPGRIFEAGNPTDAKHWMLAEDPFIWYSQRYGNQYYAVVRDVRGTFSGANGGLALFQSLDGLDWKPAKHPRVLGTHFNKSDGTFSESRVERPFLLFDANEVPIYLFSATDGYEPQGRASYNVHIPLKIPTVQLPQSNDKSIHVQNQKESVAATISEEHMGDSCTKTYRIMPIGDSITEGGKTFSNYRYLLLKKLTDAGYPVEYVGSRQSDSPAGPLLHEGYGGKNAEFLAGMIAETFSEHPADIVLIHAGHNHFMEEKPVPGIIAATEAMIMAVRRINPDVIVLLAQVIPSGKLPKYGYIPELNESLARLANRLNTAQQPVLLVDQAKNFNFKTDTIEDGVHPNMQGAEKMADRWFDALTRIIDKPERDNNVQ